MKLNEEFKTILELNYDGIFTILLALCGGLYHWLRNNLFYYEATIMDQQVKVVGFLFGVVATIMLFFGGYRLGQRQTGAEGGTIGFRNGNGPAM